MSVYDTIRYETAGEIATITLDRPDKLNAWTPQMAEEQADAIGRANADRSIGAIVMVLVAWGSGSLPLRSGPILRSAAGLHPGDRFLACWYWRPWGFRYG